MKTQKRLLCFTLMFALLIFMSHSAYATTPYAANRVELSLSFTEATAHCVVDIMTTRSTDEVSLVIKLWQGTRCAKTWNVEEMGDFTFKKSVPVVQGMPYQLTVDATINGTAYPRQSVADICD